MAFVCKWLGLYLCMRESPATESITMAEKCDLLVILKENGKLERAGGLSFDVVIKQAVASPRVLKTVTPTKEISQEFIEKKLRDAEERRLSMEASKLLSIQKDNERCQAVSQRIQELNDSFSRVAEKKLAEKMELTTEKKNAQIKALQDRLKAHALRVEAVRMEGDKCRTELKERIERKLETAGEKRDRQLTNIQERIRKQQEHIDEVLEASSKFSKDTTEKIIQKMESSLKNREEQLCQLMERLKQHDEHVQQVRQNKLNQSLSNSTISESPSFDNMDDSMTATPGSDMVSVSS